MRRAITLLVLALSCAVLLAAPAAAGTKFTFADVELPDGQVGEVEAHVKVHPNKDDSVACAYFTDDYRESLGYSFAFVEPAPTDADAVLDWCLEAFDDRFT